MCLHSQFCLPTWKKPLGSGSVELELVLIFLASDTTIATAANQQWTSEGPLANPHVFVHHNGVARILCSSSFRMIIEYLGRLSVM